MRAQSGLQRAVEIGEALVGAALAAEAVIAFFGGDIQIAALAEGKALVEVTGKGLAIAFIILAAGQRKVAAIVGLLGDDIDDAGDGVGAVLRGGAVGENFDMVNRAGGNEAEVGAWPNPGRGCRRPPGGWR